MTVTRVCPTCFHDWQDDHYNAVDETWDSCNLCNCTNPWDQNELDSFSWLDYTVGKYGPPRLHVANTLIHGKTKRRTSWVWFPENQNTGLHIDRPVYKNDWYELEAWGPDGTALVRRRDEPTGDDYLNIIYLAWRVYTPPTT